MANLDTELQSELLELDRAGRKRQLPSALKDGDLLDFTSNDYLSLAGDPRLIEAARAASAQHGSGGRAARLLGGTPLAREFEFAAASAFTSEAALCFPTGYQANTGLLASLAGPLDVILSDRLNHASLIDGARLSRARTAVFAHNDLADLQRLLSRSVDARRRLIVVEGVFSMDGDRAPIAELFKICELYDAHLIVDEAHAAGLLGTPDLSGRGAAAAFASHPRLAARVITGGKGFGAGGALVLGSQALIDVLINRARSFIFTTAPPPALVAAFAMGIEVALAEPERGRTACAAAQRLAAALGLPAPGGVIVPVPVGDETAAVAAATALAERGFDLRAVRPPTVPPGTSRLRAVVRTSHTNEQVDALAAAVLTLGLPSNTKCNQPEIAALTVPPAAPLAPVLFIAGTDTDVGKTITAAVLLRAISLTQEGVHYWKPVQTGDDSDSATVENLAALAPHQVQRPAIQLALPASPHAAAAAEGRTLNPTTIFASLGGLRRMLAPTPLVVELAGGLLVPYTKPSTSTPPTTQLDWLEEERPPFVLVARSGLGTLNHTMLSLEALTARHLAPRALVLVGEPHTSNRESLAAWTDLPILELPRLEPLDTHAIDAIAHRWAMAGLVKELLS